MKKRFLAVMIALLLAAAAIVGCAAGTEGKLTSLVSAGATLVFDTHNVTIKGNAEFQLDGQRFKTAEITYIQDGEDSFWQEKLFTPRPYMSDLETGFTVISNSGNVFLMEPYTPGVYRTGYNDPQNTIVHESMESRLLASFLKTAAAMTETELAPCITYGDNTLELNISATQTPEIVNEALLMGARFVAKRLFNIDYDVAIYDRSDWAITSTTREILFMTESCAIHEASVQFVSDDQGRLSAIKGYAVLGLDYVDKETRELKTIFELSIGDYGTSVVKSFDPEEYHVVSSKHAVLQQPETDQETADALTQRALECWKAAGFANADRFELLSFGNESGIFSLNFTDPEEDSIEWNYYIEIGDTGNALYMSTDPQNRYENWLEHEQPEVPEVSDETMNRIREFLKLVNPELQYEKLVVLSQYVYDDAVFIVLAEEDYESKMYWLDLTVQLSPDFRIVDYTSVGRG